MELKSVAMILILSFILLIKTIIIVASCNDQRNELNRFHFGPLFYFDYLFCLQRAA